MIDPASPLDRHRARLWRFVGLKNYELHPPSVFGAMHDAVRDLRANGGDRCAERQLLLPVVMRLVGHAALDGATRRGLLAWLEMVDGAADGTSDGGSSPRA